MYTFSFIDICTRCRQALHYHLLVRIVTLINWTMTLINWTVTLVNWTVTLVIWPTHE